MTPSEASSSYVQAYRAVTTALTCPLRAASDASAAYIDLDRLVLGIYFDNFNFARLTATTGRVAE
jgi:hypothetical protein